MNIHIFVKNILIGLAITLFDQTLQSEYNFSMSETKHAGGRPPKYKKEYIIQAAKLCRLGAIDKDLADFFGVAEKTIDNWKGKYPEFLQSIKESKDYMDCKVERSLYERATGYSHPEDKIFNSNGSPLIVPTIKSYPPETTAAIFWLKNRQSEKWRDTSNIDLSGKVKAEIVLPVTLDALESQITEEIPREEED